MSQPIKQYQRLLRRTMKCCWKDKRHFVAKFQKALQPLLEENPEPSWEDLVEAFGPPEEMGRSFMDKLAPKDHRKYRIRKRICIGIFVVILAAIVAYVANYMSVKPKIVYIEEELIIEETIIVEDDLADPVEE